MTSELYEADLEKALILSKLEFEQNKQVHFYNFLIMKHVHFEMLQTHVKSHQPEGFNATYLNTK